MAVFIPRPNLDLIDLLLGEHAALLSLFRHIDTRLGSMDLGQVLAAGETVEAMLMAHAVEEDGLLFHALPAGQRGVRQTLEAMLGEHNEQRRMLEELRTMENLVAARGKLQRVMELTREHFAVEERVLFGLAKELLGEDRLVELGEEFARRRGISRTV
jgi:hemerythrin-like domain-containing protein